MVHELHFPGCSNPRCALRASFARCGKTLEMSQSNGSLVSMLDPQPDKIFETSDPNRCDMTFVQLSLMILAPNGHY